MASFDTLSYAKALQQGGVPAKQAEAMAMGLLQCLKSEVATKSDIALLRTEFKGDNAGIRTELKVIYWSLGMLVVVNVTSLGFLFSLLLPQP